MCNILNYYIIKVKIKISTKYNLELFIYLNDMSIETFSKLLYNKNFNLS